MGPLLMKPVMLPVMKRSSRVEKAVDTIKTFFFKDGVQMVVDGYSLEELSEIMETRIEYREKREKVQLCLNQWGI